MAELLFLVRHAHRNLEDPSSDNGLSKRGKAQRKILTRTLDQLIPRSAKLSFLSSPKKRCRETIKLFAKSRKTKIEIEPGLNEGNLVSSKLHSFLAEVRKAKADVVIACSHGDVLPLLIKLACQIEGPLDLAKGSVAVLRVDGNSFTLEWLLQPQKTTLDF